MSERTIYKVLVQVSDDGANLDIARYLGREPLTDLDEAQRLFDREAANGEIVRLIRHTTELVAEAKR